MAALSQLDVDIMWEHGSERITSIGRLTQRFSSGAGGVEKSILDQKEEVEDAISAQRRQICRRIVGFEGFTRYSKILMSSSGGKCETGEGEFATGTQGFEAIVVL